MDCLWCESIRAQPGINTVYWELPDGTRAIEIRKVPAVLCPECGIEYQEESIIDEIENQLFLIDTNQIGYSITFEGLMLQPRLLKRNYFDFS